MENFVIVKKNPDYERFVYEFVLIGHEPEKDQEKKKW